MNDPSRQPNRYLLRPCQMDDLPALERFAAVSPVGISSLVPDRAILHERLQQSLHAFATDDASGEERYLFALVELPSHAVVGISGIAARAGFSDRFYSFRNEFVVHRSPALGITRRIHTLHLCHDLTDATLLISFHIEPDHAHTVGPQLLSRARLQFIAAQSDRFSNHVAAECPGLADQSGRCPVWDAVGRRFFGMDYPSIERLTGGRSKAFIADLMPPSPIYVELLPEEAQFAVGQLHPVGELPFAILTDEGFDTDTYLDIFDGGPTVHERLGMLKTAARRRELPIHAGALRAPHLYVLSNGRREGFRAVIAAAETQRDGMVVSPDTLALLALQDGELVHASRFDVNSEVWP